MIRYLVRRLLQAVFVLWAAYSVSFAILYLLPGDPVAAMASAGGENPVDATQVAALRHEYGFDQPVMVQYLQHLGQAATGNLGKSVSTGAPVSDLILQALPQTLMLAGAALLLAAVFGVALALGATLVRSRWLSQFLLSLPGLGVSVPTFWVGLVLVQLVSFRLGLLPALGNEGIASLILPAITLALPLGAQIAQVLAKSLQIELASAYVETARAKGASPVRVQLRHALRNASVPALTVSGLVIGQLLAGSVVVETVFSRDGVGRLTATAVGAQNIPVVQGVVVVGAVAYVLASLLVDLLNPLLDPRIVAVPNRLAGATG
jgi:peptide/nickel transport system permease protein